MSFLILVLGILLFTCLIVVHEYGHFLLARRNGVKPEEFAIFFGPKLYSRKTRKGWIFSIRAIPLGGFVRLKGEHDSDKAPGTFGSASLWAKSKIMAAGVGMNLLAALALFTLLALIGIPKLIPNQYTVKNDTKVSSQKVLVGNIEKGSPAQKAGLKNQDVLNEISVAGKQPIKITSSDVLKSTTKTYAGQKVNILYSRGGKQLETSATLVSASVVSASLAEFNKQINSTKLDCANIPSPKGNLGITPTDYTLQRSTWSAPVAAVGLSTQVTTLTFQGLGHAIGGLGSLIAGFLTGNNTARSNGQCSASSQVGGPIAIAVILKDGSQMGIEFMLFIIAIISLTLAIMNILPIPALDGGRLWLTLFTHSIRKPLSAKREEHINATGFIILLGLIILISVVDINRFILN